MENRAWYLFTKRLCGELILEEQNELNEQLLRSPDLQHKFELFEIWWNDKSYCGSLNVEEDRIAFEKFAEAIVDEWSTSQSMEDRVVFKERNDYRKIYWLAAAAILVFVVGAFLFSGNQTQAPDLIPEVVQKATTKPGDTRKIHLPDGTELWLNASSSLEYSDFTPDHRELHLDGEAYLDVVHNPEKPFLIHTPKGTVRVLGTVLNVRAYSNEERFETSLIRGKVEVVMNDEVKTTYNLKPYEKLVLNTMPPAPGERKNTSLQAANTTKKMETPQVQPLLPTIDNEPMPETAWLYNTLAFRDETFREVADKMEKWYGVEIRFRSKRLEQERLSGTFRQETLQQALNALQIITGFEYAMKDKTIIISTE